MFHSPFTDDNLTAHPPVCLPAAPCLLCHNDRMRRMSWRLERYDWLSLSLSFSSLSFSLAFRATWQQELVEQALRGGSQDMRSRLPYAPRHRYFRTKQEMATGMSEFRDGLMSPAYVSAPPCPLFSICAPVLRRPNTAVGVVAG